MRRRWRSISAIRADLLTAGQGIGVDTLDIEIFDLDTNTLLYHPLHAQNDATGLEVQTNGLAASTILPLSGSNTHLRVALLMDLHTVDGLASSAQLSVDNVRLLPEPATIVLGAMGVAMSLLYRWRQNASFAAALVVVLAPLTAAAQITIASSCVGDLGNAADPGTGYGAVESKPSADGAKADSDSKKHSSLSNDDSPRCNDSQPQPTNSASADKNDESQFTLRGRVADAAGDPVDGALVSLPLRWTGASQRLAGGQREVGRRGAL